MTTYTEAPRYIYFIRPVGEPGPVKIGCSNMPAKRLKEIATWSPVPLEIAATAPGDMELERNLHCCFADIHSHREWFRTDPRLTEFVAKIAAGVAIADAIDLADKRGNILSGRGTPNGRRTGAAWVKTPGGRLYMSLGGRLRHALRRANMHWGQVPEAIRMAVMESRDHGITDEQRAAFEAYVAAPYKDGSWPRPKVGSPSLAIHTSEASAA